MVNLLIVPIGRPTFDVDHGACQVRAALELLDAGSRSAISIAPEGDGSFFTDEDALTAALDGRVADADTADAVVVLQATFSDSSMVAAIADRLAAPIVIWSFPEARTGGRLRLNSLCGANLASYVLRRRRHAVEFVHVDPLAARAADRVEQALELAAAATPAPPAVETGAVTDTEFGRRLASMFRGDRIGVIGDPPPGFEPCEGDPVRLRELTDIDVERVSLGSLFEHADAVDDPARDAAARRVRGSMIVDDGVESAGMSESVALYGGLRALAAEHHWTAVATRCWPECMAKYGGAVCTPMAMLTENGIPAVCEADMYGAATALMLHHVAGSDPFLADLVDVDERDDTSVLWHCGVGSTNLADPGTPVIAITHPNRHRALANQFALRPGRVTVARLSQAGGTVRLVIGGGEMLRRPRPFEGTCGVLQWDEPVGDVLATILRAGLEHHVGVVYGDHRSALAALADEWGLATVWLGHAGDRESAGSDELSPLPAQP